MHYKEGETQDECICCCGIVDRRRSNVVETDGDTVDGGGRRLKICLCCWCMGCNEEGIYIWLKNLLLLYNFIFWVIGCLFLIVGIYSGTMRQEYSDEADFVFLTPAVVLCLIGSFSLVFSTLGFVGALRDNLCFLKVFVYSILIFLAVELISGILAFVFKNPAKDFVNRYVLKGLTTYYDDPDLRDVVDYMQREFQCCGGQYYRDWEVNIYHNCTSPGPKACGVPYSCCLPENFTINLNTMCGYDTLRMKNDEVVELIYVNGCIDAVLDFMLTNLNVLAGVLLGILIPQVTGVFLGIFSVLSIEKIISKQIDKEFRELHTISLRALDRDSLYTDERKRLSYPIYIRKPSIISEESSKNNNDVNSSKKEIYSDENSNTGTGDELVALITSSSDEITDL